MNEVGRSRGGFGTKIHALADALGNPIKFILTGGEQADCLQALPLLAGQTASAVLADKGYDAGHIFLMEFRDRSGGSHSPKIELQTTMGIW